MAREPLPDWRSDRLSQGRVADYKPFVMVDGEGVQRLPNGGGEVFADHSGGPSRTCWVAHPTGGSQVGSQRDRGETRVGWGAGRI